jgi:hypothetical protein
MTIRSGECLCGGVKFTVAEDPLMVRICWCRDCQHIAPNGTVNMLVPSSSLSVTGDIAEHRKTAASGSEVIRQFCPTCGSHLFARSSARPQFAVVRVGNLDDPSSVRPTMNIWASSAPEWACLDASLTRVEQQPAPPSAQSAS